MDWKKFRLYETITTIALGTIIVWSIINENFTLSIFALIFGLLLLSLFKKWSKVEDERIHMISEKASKRTIQVFGILFALVGFFWWWLASSKYLTGSLDVSFLGLFWVYSAFVLWVLYLLFYDYYSWIYGNR